MVITQLPANYCGRLRQVEETFSYVSHTLEPRQRLPVLCPCVYDKRLFKIIKVIRRESQISQTDMIPSSKNMFSAGLQYL